MEARLLTLDEIKQLQPDTDVWLERCTLSGKIHVMAITIVAAKKFGVGYYWNAEDYARFNRRPFGWRMWSARPTNEQRAAAPWDIVPDIVEE